MNDRKVFDHILGRHYTNFDGLAGMHVEDIYQDRRVLLWIATADGGVGRFDGANFDIFSLSRGVPHITVMTIAEDPDGRLLFGTLGGGLAVYDGQEFQVHTTEHGLPSNEIMSLQPQADGSMRMLTGAGIGRFVDGQCVECVTEIAGQPLGPVYDPQAVSCPDSTPEIQFHFQGISFRSGAGQMRYSHRLVGPGRAEEWSAFTPANKATYRDVPAGRFHFEVRTTDRDGLLSDVARLEVRVTPSVPKP